MCHENTMGHCEKLAVKRLGHSYFLADFIACICISYRFKCNFLGRKVFK